MDKREGRDVFLMKLSTIKMMESLYDKPGRVRGLRIRGDCCSHIFWGCGVPVASLKARDKCMGMHNYNFGNILPVSRWHSDPILGAPAPGSIWWDPGGASKILEVIKLGSAYESCDIIDKAIIAQKNPNTWVNCRMWYFLETSTN